MATMLRRERDIIARQAIGITGAVIMLVVVAGDIDRHVEKTDFGAKPSAPHFAAYRRR